MNIIVMAKAPVAGRSKTRLCPPCSPDEAAEIARGALIDTLGAVGGTKVDRRALVLDGRPGDWLSSGFDVVAQRGRCLDQRLAAAFDDVGGPALLVGMDTPQLTPELLRRAGDALMHSGVLGEARDGGWWALGLRRPDPRAFLGVPMSTSRTGSEQRRRLRSLGLAVAELPRLRDVDRFEDAVSVAAQMTWSPFAEVVQRVSAAVAGRCHEARADPRPLETVSGAAP